VDLPKRPLPKGALCGPPQFSFNDAVNYLCEFEKELENLNSKIISCGNTSELLNSVRIL